jgi:hypothetical protein
MKGNFVSMTIIQSIVANFVTKHRSTDPKDIRACVTATYLPQGNNDEFVCHEVYWGSQAQGDIIIPIGRWLSSLVRKELSCSSPRSRKIHRVQG